MEELELGVIDSYQDYYESHSTSDTSDSIAMSIMLRQGAAQMVELVLDWSPNGVKGPDGE